MARSLEDEARREEEQRVKTETEQKAKDETLAKLSQIFGYSKSVRVMEKFAGIQTYCLLVEKCMEEPDEVGDEFEFADVWKEPVSFLDLALSMIFDFPGPQLFRVF